MDREPARAVQPAGGAAIGRGVWGVSHRLVRMVEASAAESFWRAPDQQAAGPRPCLRPVGIWCRPGRGRPNYRVHAGGLARPRMLPARRRPSLGQRIWRGLWCRAGFHAAARCAVVARQATGGRRISDSGAGGRSPEQVLAFRRCQRTGGTLPGTGIGGSVIAGDGKGWTSCPNGHQVTAGSALHWSQLTGQVSVRAADHVCASVDGRALTSFRRATIASGRLALQELPLIPIQKVPGHTRPPS